MANQHRDRDVVDVLEKELDAQLDVSALDRDRSDAVGTIVKAVVDERTVVLDELLLADNGGDHDPRKTKRLSMYDADALFADVEYHVVRTFERDGVSRTEPGPNAFEVSVHDR